MSHGHRHCSGAGAEEAGIYGPPVESLAGLQGRMMALQVDDTTLRFAAAKLFPGMVLPPADFAFTVAPHPHAPRRLVAWVQAGSEGAVRAAVELLPDLWCLTRVAMKGGRVILREEADMPRGIRAHAL